MIERTGTGHTIAANDGLALHVFEFDCHSNPERDVLFVHGSFGHARVWDPLVAELEPGTRAFAIDLPGHGRSEWAPSEERYSFPHMVDDLVAVIRALGMRPVVAGHSVGSALTMHLAIEHSDLLAGAVLMDIDPRPPERQSLHLNDVGRQPAKVYESFERAVARESRIAAKAPPVVHQHLATHGYRRTEAGWAQAFDQAYLRSLASWDYVDRLSRISVPALILRGADSTVSSPEGFNALLAGIRGSRGELIHEADHQLHLERPGAVAAAINRFLLELG